MKYSLPMLLVSACMLGSINGTQSADLSDLIQQVEVSVVRIDTTTEDGSSVGSGFVVSADGIVITNHHVILGATEGTATFNTGKSARIVGTLRLDKDHDIAVIKIDETELEPLEIEAKLPRKGATVVAFGAPRGLSFSASEGIVSSVRSGEELAQFGAKQLGTWIQTTAPISPGNSGGPLVDVDGKVVGANTMTLLAGQNVNFATSCENILETMKGVKALRVVPLREGAGRIPPEAATRVGGDEIPASKISPAVIEEFIADGRDLFPSGLTIAKKNAKRLQNDLRAMKTGRIGAKAKEGAENGYDYFVTTVRNQTIYQFPDQAAKKRTIDKQIALVSKFEASLQRLADPKVGIYYFLSEVGGPALSLNSAGQVGWLRGATVSQVVDADAVHAYVGDTRIEVRGVTGLATDSAIEPMLAYICTTRTYETRIGGNNTVLVVRALPKAVLLSALRIEESELIGQTCARSETTSASSAPPHAKKDGATATTTRRWKDSSGKFDVVATFIAQDESDAVLKTAAGKVIKVPKAKLSADDQSFLRTLQRD